MEAARTSGVLMAALERTLGEEVNGANAGLIPIQQTPEADDDANRLTTSIRNARGRTLAVTTSAAPISGGGMQGSAARGPSDMARRRIGAEPPSPLVTLRRDVEACISSIYGIPAALLTSATGASQAREDYRRVLHSVIVPLGRLVAEELGAKLDAPGARLEFRELGAADVQGRARAWRSLVGATESAAGMTPAEASAVVGFGD